MPLILIVGLVAWFLLGSPTVTVADWFWPDDAAPWEEVDAFYYPNRANLSEFQIMTGLSSVQECRDWAFEMAATLGDLDLARGDYECGIQRLDTFAGRNVYRATAR